MLFRILPVFLLLALPGSGWGQPAPQPAGAGQPPGAAAQPAGAVAQPAAVGAQPAASGVTSGIGPDKAKTPEAPSGKDWRDTSGYPFPSLPDTVAAAQNMAQAMLLRDYCSNRKLPDDFVRDRLARFSRITGREEDCQSLLDY
jgi:hypothetical protein